MNFKEISRIGLGIYNTYSFYATGYCFFKGYLIVSLMHGSYKSSLKAFTIDDNGILTLVSTYDFPFIGYYSPQAGCIHSDGTYLYCLCRNIGLRAFSFDGVTFTPLATTSGYNVGAQYQIAFGNGYIFTFSSYSNLRALKFNGTSFNIVANTSDLIGFNESSVFWYNNKLYGLYYYEPDHVFGLRVLTFDGSSFSLEYEDTTYKEWLYSFTVNTDNSIFWNNKLMSYDTKFNVINQYDRPYTFEKALIDYDNLIKLTSYENGLYVLKSDSPYISYGYYSPGVTFSFCFKYNNFDIIIDKVYDTGLYSGQYTIRSGILFGAQFYGIPLSIIRGESVSFSDLSFGDPSAWNWDFGDSNTSSLQDISHIYDYPGTYTVSLSITKNSEIDTHTKTNYINVTNPTLTSDFSGNPVSGLSPLLVSFTDLSVGEPTSWEWNFGDGSPISTDQNPSHYYENQGLFSVTLTIHKGIFNSTITKEKYITVFNNTPRSNTSQAVGFVRPKGPTLIFD